ncbi:MAG: hypothetical protein M1834_003029 [Cirrosporium novae-zelandiae]|nr:MAG: hypothetical protein M1834_003029 [Cirrosporium novae-zelandiae]
MKYTFHPPVVDEEARKVWAHSKLRLPNGTVRLIENDGRLRLVPVRSANLCDPLSEPRWRKLWAVLILSLWSAIAISAVSDISFLMPTLQSYYQDINPQTGFGGIPSNSSGNNTSPGIRVSTAIHFTRSPTSGLGAYDTLTVSSKSTSDSTLTTSGANIAPLVAFQPTPTTPFKSNSPSSTSRSTTERQETISTLLIFISDWVTLSDVPNLPSGYFVVSPPSTLPTGLVTTTRKYVNSILHTTILVPLTYSLPISYDPLTLQRLPHAQTTTTRATKTRVTKTQATTTHNKRDATTNIDGATTTTGPLKSKTTAKYLNKRGDSTPTPEELGALISFPILCVGLGAFLSVLLGFIFGTRLAMLICAIFLTVGLIWATASCGIYKGLYSHIFARCIVGLGCGAVQSLIPFLLDGLFFVDERDGHLTILWCIGGIGSTILGFSSTYIAVDLDWRGYYGILALLSLIALGAIFFIVPETTWPRTASSYSKFLNYMELQPQEKLWIYFALIRDAMENHTSIPFKSTLVEYVYATILNGCYFCIVASVLETYPTVLLAPPYNWELDCIAFLTVPNIIACILLVFLTGYMATVRLRNLAERDFGRYEPEHQLGNLVIPIVVGFIGTLVFGVACESPEKYHWMVSLAMIGFIQLGFLATNIILLVYSMSCFPDMSGSIAAVVGGTRYMISFAVCGIVTESLNARGYGCSFGIYATVLAGIALIGLPIHKWGKPLRRSMQSWWVRTLWWGVGLKDMDLALEDSVWVDWA